MKLADILAHKGYKVHSIGPSAALAEVVQVLVRHNIGSLMVCGEDDCKRMLGIITERDILRACAARRHLETTEAGEVMTTDVVTGSPSDSVEDTMGVMTENRIRHLPVLENDELVGLVSIGDIVKAQHDALTMENHYLKSYLHG
ncbi:MAG: CBS domain-containing protein [Pirellulales bacterium]